MDSHVMNEAWLWNDEIINLCIMHNPCFHKVIWWKNCTLCAMVFLNIVYFQHTIYFCASFITNKSALISFYAMIKLFTIFLWLTAGITFAVWCMPSEWWWLISVGVNQKLYEVHSQFSKDLRMATTKESVHTIADCFITNKEKFLIYGEYCSNLLQAQDLLDQLCNTKPDVRNRVTVCNSVSISERTLFYGCAPSELITDPILNLIT